MSEGKTLKQGLLDLSNKVANAVDDLASLEVTTYTGSFNLTINDIVEQNGDQFRIKSLMQNNPVTLNAKLELLAYSRFEIDADVASIVKSNLSAQDQDLLAAHNELVKTAQEARKSMLEFVKDLIPHSS